MKVHILTRVDYDETEIIGVFTDLAKAEQIKAEIGEPEYGRLEIDTCETDSVVIDHRPAWHAYSKPFSAEVESIHKSSLIGCWEDRSGAAVKAWQPGLSLWAFRATDREEARRIAGEKFREYAEKTGWPKNKETTRG